MSDGRWICPTCFVTFPAKAVDRRFSLCPHCESEAIGSDLVPIAELLAKNSPEEIEAWVSEWRAATGFFPEYHAAKLKRMEALAARSRGKRR